MTEPMKTNMVSAGENEGVEVFAPCMVDAKGPAYFYDKANDRNIAFTHKTDAEARIVRAQEENPQLLDLDLRVVTVRLAKPS